MSRITDFFTINYSHVGGLSIFSQDVLTTDWVADAGKFKLEFAKSLHSKSGHVVEVYEGTTKVSVDSITVDISGNVKIVATRQFAGRVVIG